MSEQPLGGIPAPLRLKVPNGAFWRSSSFASIFPSQQCRCGKQELEPVVMQNGPEVLDGHQDFDFEFGTWKTHLRRLLNPLTGSNAWVEYQGTTVVREIWNGRANLVELEVEGPAGRIQALSLRLYNPEARQWSLNFSSVASGSMGQPVIGEFKNGRGEFFGSDTLDGRAIFVRFAISCDNPNAYRFEQAFSADGGQNWETNWIALDTRV